jgi:mono/diheme cytochrome c family protein
MLRITACLLVLMPGLAWAQDVDHGHQLAARWCANCHVVERTAAAASANGLPTFPALAANPKATPELLRATMTAQHGRMPDLSISKRDQDDLVAYIFSLRQK